MPAGALRPVRGATAPGALAVGQQAHRRTVGGQHAGGIADAARQHALMRPERIAAQHRALLQARTRQHRGQAAPQPGMLARKAGQGQQMAVDQPQHAHPAFPGIAPERQGAALRIAQCHLRAGTRCLQWVAAQQRPFALAFGLGQAHVLQCLARLQAQAEAREIGARGGIQWAGDAQQQAQAAGHGLAHLAFFRSRQGRPCALVQHQQVAGA